MPSLVSDFYKNKGMREEVKQYVDDIFMKEVITRTFERKDTAHLADAKEIWDKAFDQMEADFSPPKEPINYNEAR